MERKIFRSRDLCITALLIAPSFLFNTNSSGKIAQFLLFWLAAFLIKSEKKTFLKEIKKVLITLSIIGGVVFFNLLAPYGQVLLTVGAFKITEGALRAGIDRAITLEGLIMLSKAGGAPDLRFPGRFGALMGESLRLFSLITEKRRVSPKTFIADIDALLFELSEAPPLPAENAGQFFPPSAERSTFFGLLILASVVVFSWFFYFPLFPVITSAAFHSVAENIP